MPIQNYTEEDIQNGIPANAKVKSIEGSNVSYQTNPVSKTQELINKYFNTKEESPVFDQAKVERLQKMGRINTLGRGLNVLGDGLSLALGANVKRKAPDTTAPALYQSYENTLDQHTQEVKGYKQRQFQKSLNDIQFGIGRLDKETDQDYRERVQKANNEFKKVKNAQELAKWQLDYDINKGKATESERHNKEMEKAALIRAGNSGSKNKGDQPVTIRTKNKTYELDQSQVDLYSSEMMSQPDEVKRKYTELYEEVPETKAAKNQYGQMVETPTGRNILKLKSNITRGDLARVYLDKEEESKRLSEEDSQRRSNSKIMLTNPGMIGNTQPVQQAAPKTAKKVPSFFQ